jgi:hypothetical protein
MLQGERAPARVYQNQVVEVEVDGRALYRHDPSGTVTAARFSNVLIGSEVLV